MWVVRSKSYLPQPVLIQIYKSLIQPHFHYCSSVWDRSKLQKFQNRAARIITGTDYNVRSAESLRTLDWDNLERKS